MKIWKDFAGNTGAATTTWKYHPQRGWLDNKRYDDDKGPNYEYWPSGRLKKRTWARGITTNYAFNNAGDLESVDYSDATPDVTFQHDRRGRVGVAASVSDAMSFTHNSPGQLESHSLDLGALGVLAVQVLHCLARLNNRTCCE